MLSPHQERSHSTVGLRPLNAEVGGGGVATKHLYPLVCHLGAVAKVKRREPSEAAHRLQPSSVKSQGQTSYFIAKLTTTGKRRTSSRMPSSFVL